MTFDELIELQKRFASRELELARNATDPSSIRLHYHLAALHNFRAEALERDAHGWKPHLSARQGKLQRAATSATKRADQSEDIDISPT